MTRYEYGAVRMGVRARVVLYGTDEPQAAAAAREALATIERLEQIMSDYRPSSELNMLARAAGTGEVAISPELAQVLRDAVRVSKASGGAFDVTVGPASLLWREMRDSGAAPDPARIAAAAALIDWRRVVVRGRSAEITTPGVKLDLGGIGKGAAAWAALERLRELGYPRAMVALAGDVAVGDPPPGAAGWTISIAWPGEDAAERIVRSLLVRDASVSTSGAAEQWIEVVQEPAQIRRQSHIIDPRTAQGVWTTRAITVCGPGGPWADALATGGLVLLARGEEAALHEMMRQFPRHAALIAADASETVADTAQSHDIQVIGDRNAVRWSE